MDSQQAKPLGWTVYLQEFQKDKIRAEKKGDLKEVAKICNVLGAAYFQSGDYDDAIAEHEVELAVSESLQDGLDIAVAHRRIGECHCELGQYDKAVHHQKQHLRWAQSASNAVEEQRAHATLGRTHLCSSETSRGRLATQAALGQAQASFLRSLEVCQRLREKVPHAEFMEMKARIYLNLGLVFDSKCDIERCKEFLNQGLQIAQQANMLEDQYRCLYNLGWVSQRNGELAEAGTFADKSMDVAVKLKDKAMKVDAIILQATVKMCKDDYRGARKYLQKAYKLDKTCEKTRISLTTVVKMEQLQKKFSATSSLEERRRLWEKLGDCVVSMSSKHAISCYSKMLECARQLGEEGQALIPIYISLAQTYMDEKNFKKAEQFFRKELSCYTDQHEEMCRTYMNIAEAQDQSDQGSDTVKSSYVQAMSFAKKCKSLRLQVMVLESLQVMQTTSGDNEGMKETEEMLRRIKESKAGGYGSDEEEESQPVGESDDDSSVDLSLLSDSDDSNAEEEFDVLSGAMQGVGIARTKRRSHSAQFKVNEKGETPLHKACIDGRLIVVRNLLQKGHPVNPRDYAGWLPLHEAANHGHIEILKELLDNGAWINDRGGEKCGGITPLHDACNCGNVEIIELLIKRGANVHAKDDEGTNALSCLVNYRKENRNLSADDKATLHAAEHLLRKTMGGDNPHLHNRLTAGDEDDEDTEEDLPHMTSRRSGQRARRRSSLPLHDVNDDSNDSHSSGRRRKRRSGVTAVENALADDENVIPPSLAPSRENLNDPGRGVSAYVQAISGLGSALKMTPAAEMVQESDEDVPALIPEGDFVGDTWLVDDMKESVKRKRGDIDELFKTMKGEKRSKSEASDSHSGTSGTQRKKKRVSDETRCTVGEMAALVTHNNNEEIMDINDFSDNDDIHTPNSFTSVIKAKKAKKSRQVKMTAFGVRSSDTPSFVESPVSAAQPMTKPPVTLAMRLKIRIKDKVILVPVMNSGTDERTVSWLSDEAASRYYKLYSLRPLLSLATKDGAVLAPDDVVGMLLSDNEELLGIVDGWDLPSLPVRYSEACTSLKLTSYHNICHQLQDCEGSHILKLVNLALRPIRFQPIARALQCQATLKELHVPGNILGDSGLEQLTKVWGTLPNLQLLDLSNNNITAIGLQNLSRVAENSSEDSAAEKPLQNLVTLNLSYNPLGDSCSQPLAGLVRRLPRLHTLGLSSCMLTMKLFQEHRLSLTEAMQGCDLTQLNISYNDFGATGIELMLRCTPVARLISLDLTSTCRTSDHNLLRHLHKYTLQSCCVLERLHLADCHLNTDQTPDICRLIANSKTLTTLSFRGNSKLSNTDIVQILEAASASQSPLVEVDFTGCSLSSPLPTDLIDSVNDKLSHQVPLRMLSLSSSRDAASDVDLLEEVWKTKWGQQAVCRVDRGGIQLSVLDE